MHKVGTDIVEIQRVRSLIEKYGDKFLYKLFSFEEIKYCQSHSDPPIHFAGRFSAKESIRKSMSAFLDLNTFKFRELSIVNDINGRPYLDKKLPINLSIDISISHTKTYATSVAFLEYA